MKVLYLPLNSPDFIQQGMYDAFNNLGVDLKVFDYNNILLKNKVSIHDLQNKLIREALEFKPDLMHMQLQFTDIISHNTIKYIKNKLPKTIITNWTGDCRDHVPAPFVSIGNEIDYNLISSTGQLKLYSSVIKKPVKYWQIGIDPKLNFPKNKKSNFKFKAAFIASNHNSSNFPGHQDRVNTAILLSKTFSDKFALYGYGWGKIAPKSNQGYIHLSKVNDIYNDSNCCISVSNFNNVSHSFSDRLLICLASGRPTISLAFPGWESYFTNNRDIIIANSVDEISEKVKWVLENPQKANEIGENGSRKILSEHTYTSRVIQLLNITGLR